MFTRNPVSCHTGGEVVNFRLVWSLYGLRYTTPQGGYSILDYIPQRGYSILDYIPQRGYSILDYIPQGGL